MPTYCLQEARRCQQGTWGAKILEIYRSSMQISQLWGGVGDGPKIGEFPQVVQIQRGIGESKEPFRQFREISTNHEMSSGSPSSDGSPPYHLFQSSTGSSTNPCPIFLTVEHASNLIPVPWPKPSESDAKLLEQHWGIDLCAEQVAIEIAEELSKRGLGTVKGIAARFSRLLCDANRDLKDDEEIERKFREGLLPHPGTMMRRTCEDGRVEVGMNRNLSIEDRTRRIEQLYNPYHDAISWELERLHEKIRMMSAPLLVFSIHSFTDLYEGKKRTLEVGVLYRDDIDEPLAELMVSRLREAGFKSDINEPWSGKRGFMASANRHAREIEQKRESRALMIEARQDLLVENEWRKKLVSVVVDSLQQFYRQL